jgi:AcrR family transcriptional regulator
MPHAPSEAAAPGRVAPLYRKLRPRRNGPAREEIAANQRARLCGAMIEAVAAAGYDQISVAGVCRLAGVSKRTFYELFDNKAGCFLATHDSIVACAMARVRAAQGHNGDSETGLGGSIEALALAAGERPKAACLALLAVPSAGRAALVRRDRARLQLERILASSFELGPHGSLLPPLVARGIACGAERAMRLWLLGGRVQDASELAQELAAWAQSYDSMALAALADVAPDASNLPVSWSPARPRTGSESARMVRAAAEIVARGGYSALSITRIARRAEASEEAFRATYESAEDCFLEALDVLGLEALISAAKTSRRAGDGLPGVCRGIAALMEHLARDCVLREVLVLQELPAGSPAHDRRERLLGGFADLFAQRIPGSRRTTQVLAEASAGAVFGVVRQYAAIGAADMLPGLAPHVAYLALTPRVGAEAAAEAILAGCRELAAPDGSS